MRTHILSSVVFLLLAHCVSDSDNATAVERPNIVFLFADDQRADTISAHGNRHIQTPNLDLLVDAAASLLCADA